MNRARQKAQRYGAWAEWIAAWRLRVHGYRILARRFKVPVGEIDIVAVKGDTLAIVEVKARRDLDTAAESISAHQRGRITRAALAFCQANPRYASASIRFDVMLVRPWRLPVHIVGAWQ